MKIGLFTDAYFPIISGVSLSVDTLAIELRKLGHEVYIIAHYHEDAIEDPYVIRIKGYRLPMKGMKEYRIGKVTRKLVRQMIGYHFDIIHCHTEFTMGRLGRRAAKKTGVPVVHTYHTMYEDYVHFVSKMLAKPLRFAAKWYSKWFANQADVVIFPTIKVKNTFDGYGFKGPGHIIPTGIYLEKFQDDQYDPNRLQQMKEQYGLNQAKIVLLFLGRVSREKSIADLLEQYANVASKDVLLLIVGDGPDKPEFVDIIHRLGIDDFVIFTGMVAPEDVGQYYRLADLFVNFSVTETQGLTYIESLASGTPLLVKYDDNLSGVVDEGVNGYTFEQNQEFVTKLQELASNPEQLQKLQQHARSNMTRFSAQTYASKVNVIYQSLYKG